MTAPTEQPTPAIRTVRRNLITADLQRILDAVDAEAAAAADRAHRIVTVLTSHTLWQRQDGANVCDFDGERYPCSTVSALAFSYGLDVLEDWEAGSNQVLQPQPPRRR